METEERLEPSSAQEKEIKRIKWLILKSISAERSDGTPLSSQEREELESWLSHSPKRRELFEKLSSSTFLTRSFSQIEAIKRRRARRRRNGFAWAAATVALMITAGLSIALFVEREVAPIQLSASEVSLSIEKRGIENFLLADKSGEKRLAKSGIIIRGDTIDYSGSKVRGKERHTLNVPKRKFYTVLFQDGSCVKLNSHSTLSYNPAFNKSDRVVELSGEGYFEVEREQKRPFVVKSREQEVVVRGTSFNVKAYTNEKSVETTLVEGSIEVVRDGESSWLQPGEQAVVESGRETRVERVDDLARFVSWRDGYYCFESEPLEGIMNNFSRWYGVEVLFKNEKLKEIRLSGKLRRDETPRHLIGAIGRLQSVELLVEDNLIIVKERE